MALVNLKNRSVRQDLYHWAQYAIVLGVLLVLLMGIAGAFIGAHLAENQSEASSASSEVGCVDNPTLACFVTTSVSKGELFLLAIGLLAGGFLELTKVDPLSRSECETLRFFLTFAAFLASLGWAATVAVVSADRPDDYEWLMEGVGGAILVAATLAVAICVLISATSTRGTAAVGSGNVKTKD
jgi:hypothetical protein